MKQEQISVIVPVYNVEKYVDKCLLSIKKQTYDNLQIIVIDDASTDKSGDIVDTYVGDSRFHIIHLKQNGGLSHARNVGLSCVSADYITFVDSDDYIDLNHIERLYESMKNGNSLISISGYIFENENGDILYEKIPKGSNMCIMHDEAIELLCYNYIESYAWNKLFQRTCFEDVLFPENIKFEDIIVMYRIFKKAERVSFTGATGYHYLMRSDSTIHSKQTYVYSFKASYLRWCEVNSDNSISEIQRSNLLRGVLKSCANSAYYAIYVSKNNEKSDDMMQIKKFWKDHKVEIKDLSKKFYLKVLFPNLYSWAIKLKGKLWH